MNEYYSIFEETQMYNLGQTQKYLIKYNNSGEILLVEKLPHELHNSYYLDFFTYNNQIYIQLPDNNSKYIFDFKTNKFIKTTKGNDIVYEDNNYTVMYRTFGEWGDATWFINKKDKTQNFTSIDGHNTNFVNGKYYLTNISSIAEISDPKNLTKSTPKQDYYSISNKEGIFDSSDYDKGIQFIYKDSIKNDFDRKSLENLNYVFLSSFVSNNRLYQITQLKDKTAITKINNNKVDIVHKLDEKYDIFSWHNEYRNTKNNYRFLKFNNGYNSFGFLEVNDNNIEITKVKYKYDTIQYIKSDNILRLISSLNDKKNLSKNEISEFEKTSNGLDIQQYRNSINHNGYYPKKYEKIDIETINFIKSENEYITQDIEYLFTRKYEQLKSIFIDWDRTKFFNQVGKNYFPIRNEDYTEIDKHFKQKYHEIIEELMKTGKHIDVKIKPNKGKYESWILNGWRFNLYGIPEKNINGITLFICKQEDFNEDQ
jgi:hypothetical protein